MSDPTVNEIPPTFLPRKGVLMRQYHVLVLWPDGRRERVGRFCRRPDAARWIREKSAKWLMQKFAEQRLDGLPVRNDAPANPAREPAAAQIDVVAPGNH
jgi:hypothetical protein